MENKTLYISFSAEVNQNTTENLMGVVAQKVNAGIKDIYLLISSPGGSVMNGINVYNFLKALPINLTTHNIGIVVKDANGWKLNRNKEYSYSPAMKGWEKLEI